jgi:5-formyltetrahydrofolate cyclo-ligase
MDKTQLRRQISSSLVKLSEKQRIEESKKACQFLMETEQFKNASVVMLYLPLPHEVNTTSVILTAWQQGKLVAVPKISWQQRHMLPVEITSLESGFSTGNSGLKNPITGVPTPIEDIDVIVTPGLAFNKEGDRLGRGGAFFDRFFNSNGLNATKIGFAFSQQLFDDIPMEEHDMQVDMVVTDKGIINCR